MSFLAGRLAATEGAYFLHESKHAAGRLAQKFPSPPSSSASAKPSPSAGVDRDVAAAADVLPEILRHSIPIKGAGAATPSAAADPHLATASKWALNGGGDSTSNSSSAASSGVLNPLRAYVSMPQATFGPKRWQLPNEQPNFSASTANDLRRDRHPTVDPEKLKAVVAGYSQIGKAFVVATLIVFGGATALFVHTAHKLQLQNADDIRVKGKDLLQPQADMLRDQIGPLRTWAVNMSKKWHVEGSREAKEKTITKELSRRLRARTVD